MRVVQGKERAKVGSTHWDAYGDEWFGNESIGKKEGEITALPTGNQAVPLQNQTGTATQLKEDGIRVILLNVFLDLSRCVLSL